MGECIIINLATVCCAVTASVASVAAAAAEDARTGRGETSVLISILLLETAAGPAAADAAGVAAAAAAAADIVLFARISSSFSFSSSPSSSSSLRVGIGTGTSAVLSTTFAVSKSCSSPFWPICRGDCRSLPSAAAEPAPVEPHMRLASALEAPMPSPLLPPPPFLLLLFLLRFAAATAAAAAADAVAISAAFAAAAVFATTRDPFDHLSPSACLLYSSSAVRYTARAVLPLWGSTAGGRWPSAVASPIALDARSSAAADSGRR